MNDTHDYYVEALGEMNKTVAEFLGTRASEYEHGVQRCTDGKDHQLWKCPGDLLTHLTANQRRLRGTLRFFTKTPAGYVPVEIPQASEFDLPQRHENLATLRRRKAHRNAVLLGNA